VSQHEIVKKSQTPYFGVSRSFKVIDVDNPKILVTVLVLMSSMSVPICNRFYARRANNGKIINVKEGVRTLVFTLLFEGNPLTQGLKILSQNTIYGSPE